jgi:hypothetical protein
LPGRKEMSIGVSSSQNWAVTEGNHLPALVAEGERWGGRTCLSRGDPGLGIGLADPAWPDG